MKQTFKSMLTESNDLKSFLDVHSKSQSSIKYEDLPDCQFKTDLAKNTHIDKPGVKFYINKLADSPDYLLTCYDMSNGKAIMGTIGRGVNLFDVNVGNPAWMDSDRIF